MPYTIYDYTHRKTNVHSLSNWWSLTICATVLVLGWITKQRLLSLPTGLTVNDLPTHKDSFIAERAFYDLNILTSFGTRPVGSDANEKLAVDFFKKELGYIKDAAHANQRIETDVQVVSGAYFINFKPHPMNNVYRNVQNVVVMLAGRDHDDPTVLRNNTLMLNCHFDSVAGSPGASDDAASCAVMLEVLRVLSRQETRLRHGVVFLFNGAEETPLQASHGFITQHKWAKDVRAFLNMESVGSNGKEMLFQSGPNHGWLIDMFKAAVPHPNGQVAAEELFQLGLIPSDTDFRIFRDFGHIPGMDFAHNMNGYRYHTKYDHIDYLSPAVLQRTGDNILALVRKIANSDELANTDAYANGRMVFYDVFGFFVIAYAETAGQVINILVSVVSVLFSVFLLHLKGISRRNVRKEILYGLVATLGAFILSGAFNYGVAHAVDYTGRAMSWYTRTYFAILLYSLPAVAMASAFFAHFGRVRDSPLSTALQAQSRLAGVNIIWALGCIAASVAGFRAAYVLMVPVLITAIVNITIGALQLQNSIRKWLYLHLIGQIFVVLWATHFYHSIISVFIPIAGRSGGHINPDVIIALLSTFFTYLIGSYLFPLVGLLRNRKFLFAVIAVFVATHVSFILTHIHFPYGDDLSNPTPQRHFVTHAVRKVFDLNGRIQYTDSGYWFREFDRNVEKTIDSLTAPDLPIRQEENVLCKDLPNCGLPLYTCRQKYTGGFWLPSAPPLLPGEAKFTTSKLINLSSTLKRLELVIEGSYLNSLQLRPKKNVKFINWNILDTPPVPTEFTDREEYMVMITHGLGAEPMHVTLDFETAVDHTGPIVDVNLVTTHWTFNATPIFAELLARFPKWAFPVANVASLQAYVF